MNTCPVCRFPGLYDPPWVGDSPSDEICPSCGIHFGYDDAAGRTDEERAAIYEAWQLKWLDSGAHWWSSSQPQPAYWNPAQGSTDR